MNFENVSRVFPFPMCVLTSGILSTTIPLKQGYGQRSYFHFFGPECVDRVELSTKFS